MTRLITFTYKIILLEPAVQPFFGGKALDNFACENECHFGLVKLREYERTRVTAIP